MPIDDSCETLIVEMYIDNRRAWRLLLCVYFASGCLVTTFYGSIGIFPRSDDFHAA